MFIVFYLIFSDITSEICYYTFYSLHVTLGHIVCQKVFFAFSFHNSAAIKKARDKKLSKIAQSVEKYIEKHSEKLQKVFFKISSIKVSLGQIWKEALDNL